MVEGNCFSDEIDTLPWKKDELIIIAAPDHPLSKRKMKIEYLYNAKLILREPGSGTREKFDEAMQKKIVPFLELNNTEAIKQAVCSGLGNHCSK